jgi:predicted P-loop ATPase
MRISKAKSLYDNDVKDIDLQGYIDSVKNGDTQDLILDIRNTNNKKEQDKLKKKLPVVIISAICVNGQSRSNIKDMTGLINIDFDGIEENEVNSVRKTLQNDKYTLVCNLSARGKGFSVIVKINPKKFIESFLGLQKYYLESYGLEVDEACKDEARRRFISYDPEIYDNKNALKFTDIVKPQETKKHEKIILVQSDFDSIVKQISDQSIDLSDDDYSKYLAIGFGLADTFGEQGRDYFHHVCKAGAKYNSRQLDKQYNQCLKAKSHGVTIATFYHFCKEKGIQTYSEETKEIIKRTTTLKRSGIVKEGVINHLQEFDGIEESKSKDIVEQIFKSNHNFLKAIQKDEDKNDTAIIAEYVQENFDFKQNEITRKIEVKGKPITDRDLNTCYIKTKIALGDINVPQGDFISIVYSDSTIMYNPILQFIGNNNNIEIEKDLIRELADSIQARNQDEQERNYLFIKKWFIGMVSTALKNGVSPLSLVLCGGQNTGKTEWFRRLLPKELKSLYAESKLDAGKDDEILMTQKILIVDDEFGGKRQQEEKKFKEITSKEVFNLREPYGRVNVDLHRLATLGGTTNDTSVLNDPTGNRRLIPVFVQSIDHDRYNAIDKDLLFIQAYREFKDGFNYSLTKDEIKLLNDNTQEFEQVDTLEELFLTHFTHNPEYGVAEYLTNTEILIRIQNISNAKIGSGRRLGLILKKLNFKQVSKRINGTPKKVYKVYFINGSKVNTDYDISEKPPF